MKKYAAIGIAGYVLSASTWVFMLIKHFHPAICTYILSYLLRSITWIILGKKPKVLLFTLTGATIMILGSGMLLSLFHGQLMIALISWMLYSMTEVASYQYAQRKFEVESFKYALISAIGLMLLFTYFFTDSVLPYEASIIFQAASAIFIASSIAAAFSFHHLERQSNNIHRISSKIIFKH